MKFRWIKNQNQIPAVANEITHKFNAEVKENENVLTIYGEIGDFWWDSISANDVKKSLDEMTGDVIVKINSPGGDAFDGIAIYNLLKDYDGKVTVYVDGLAASAASIIAMGADELIMNTGTMLMIHEAWTFAFGSKTDIKKTLNALNGLDGSLADIYMTKYQGERSEIETMMENETWFKASEAVEVGLATKVNEEVEETEDDPEEYKNNILQRFRSQKDTIAASANKSILEKFKRQ